MGRERYEYGKAFAIHRKASPFIALPISEVRQPSQAANGVADYDIGGSSKP
jgi:hypothetical protein